MCMPSLLQHFLLQIMYKTPLMLDNSGSPGQTGPPATPKG